MNLEKIHRLLLALVFVLLTVAAVYSAMRGQVYWLQILVLFVILGVISFYLRDRYWILLPIAMLSGITVMNIFDRQIRLSELALIACSVLFLLNTGVLRIPFRFNPVHSWPVYLHLLWVVFIFCLNPVGLAITGSQMIGARFYVQILMGAAMFTILANQAVSERAARQIILVGLLLSFVSPLLSYLDFQRDSMLIETDAFYTWHQTLTRPASLLLYYALARFAKINNLRFLLLFGLAVLLVLLSGKRAAFVLTMMMPALAAALLHRTYTRALTRLALVGLLVASLMLGHGALFSLPLVSQRAMALLPGNWDHSVAHLREDVYRQNVHRYAWVEIRNSPLLGRRGYAMGREDLAYISHAAPTAGRDVFYGAAYTSNWHSMFLGLWVDFGLPAVFFFACFMAIALIYGRSLFKESRGNRHRNILSGILFLNLLATLITAYTSGHSAESPFNRWWILGLFIAIRRGIRRDITANNAAGQLPSPPEENS